MQTNTMYSILGYSVSSAELLIAGAVLLFLAACLLIFRRRQRVVLDRSFMTDELMAHLAHIADSLDRLAARPPDRIVVQAPPQTENAPHQPPEEAPRTIPYSIFGREIS